LGIDGGSDDWRFGDADVTSSAPRLTPECYQIGASA
jgi:hypothetical protein